MLAQAGGEIVTREEIRKCLWPNDTIVEFDHSIHTAIAKLRKAFEDSAESPKYIETIPRRGYRLMVPVEWIGAESTAADSGEESCASPAESSSDDSVPKADSSAADLVADSDSGAVPKARLKVGRLTGKVVSHYRVLEVIGGGGMGLVYRAEDLKLGRAVALKFLPEEVGDDPKARERFEREAKAVSALSHTNICPIYEFDEYEGLPFFAMELLQGRTLRDHLADNRFRLTQPEGLEIAIQIASGLEAAHEKGIIHRDIKPANIFVTEKNVAKILDFGVAKMAEAPDLSPANWNAVLKGPGFSEGAGLQPRRTGSIQDKRGNQSPSGLIPVHSPGDGDRTPEGVPLQNNKDGADGTAEAVPFQNPGLKPGEENDAQRRAEARHYPHQTTLTRTGVKLGTAGYMSPEQVRGEPLDARTDIFSFGLVLYEMATGQRAFIGETEAILHDAIVNRDPKHVRELAPEISPALAETIEKCLEKEPKQRLRNAHELRSALLEAQHASPPVAPLPEEDKPAASLRKGWIEVVLAAALLIAVVATVIYRRAHAAPKLTDKDTIVVADFENKTGDEVFDGSLSEALRVGLEQTPFLNLLTQDKVNRVAQEIGLSNEQALTSERARQVCLKTNSAAVIAGSITDAGNGYQIALRTLRCENGAVMASVNGVAEQRNAVTRELGLAAVELRKELGEPSKTLQEFNQPLEVATTSSVEALRSLVIGKQKRVREGDGEAMPFFRRAVEIDPNFAMAYSRLGSALWNLGRRDSARESRQKAYDLRDRLTKQQYFDATGNYFGEVRGDLETSATQWAEMARLYPNSFLAHAYLAWTLRVLGNYADSASEAREAIRLDPSNYSPYYNLMMSEMALRRYSEAKAAFDEARSRGLDNEQLRNVRYDVAFFEDDKVGMQEQLDQLRRMGRLDSVLHMEAFAELFSGHWKSFRRFLDEWVATLERTKERESLARGLAELATVEAEIGETNSAGKHSTAAISLSSERAAALDVAYALARSGNVHKAEQLATQLKAEAPDDTEIKNYEPCIEVIIAMNRNAMVEARDALRTACPNSPPQTVIPSSVIDWRYTRGLVYLKQHEAEKAVTVFQSLPDHVAEQGSLGSFYGALARVQLARAYAMMGDKDAARKSYQDFLTLWKDADPDIPIYKQAKAEYAKLK
jgi:serine/threonine protein kinase/DNA-binding winged helix-turn-helix (wHTH) protein/Flp pilus assembly protein TadD